MKTKYLGILLLIIFLFIVPVSFASSSDGNELLNSSEIEPDQIVEEAIVETANNDSYFSDDNEGIEEPILDDSFANPRITYTEKNTFYVNASYTGFRESGTVLEPFKTIDSAFSSLTFNKTVSNIFIANGNYKVSKPIEFVKNLNIIGENSFGTIIDGQNTTEIFNINKNKLSVSIINLTLTNGNKYYGGAIYNNRSNVKLINVIFRDNYAVGYNLSQESYSPAGGALYNEAGTYRIYNSTFRNNRAKSSLNVYGGAIYNDLGTLSILNSKFIDNHIYEGDYGSGGAIYNFNGFLTVFNSTFVNNRIDSNYSIGGAIYNYEAHNVYIINSTFDGNRIYGNYTFGSAIASSASLFEVVNSTVINNWADGIAPENTTIYNLNGIYNFINSRMANNTIKEARENILMCLEDQFVISKAFDDELLKDLPSKYDLRDYGWVTNAKSQGSSGACWAFTIYSALESFLLKQENITYDFSENNIKNVMNFNGINSTDWSDGGNYQMALAYLLRWSGPVDEEDDPFSAYSVIPNYDLTPLKHVQGAMFLPMRMGYLDNDQIKYAIMKYGALYVSLDGISMSKNEYNPYPNIPNHAVAIVGWDDEFPASKFTGTRPEGDGAFIIKNSWGPSYGEKGFGYVSYYDKTFAGFSLDSVSALAFTDVENITNYKDIYQYDILGNTYESLGFSSNIAWLANQFTAISNNPLQAIGFYTYGASEYLIDVYVNGNLKHSQEGKVGYGGYHTIKLSSLVNLVKGDTFRINLKLNTYDSIFPIAIESARNGYSSKATSSLNQSFVSSDGVKWIDIAQDLGLVKIAGCFYNKTLEQANVCLKAYTSTSGDLRLNVSSSSSHFFKDDEIRFMFSLTNVGDHVNDINVSLVLDDVVGILDYNYTKGSFINKIWIIDDLKHGESAFLNLTVKMLVCKDHVENYAAISSSDYIQNNGNVSFNLTYAGLTSFIADNVTSLSKSGENINIKLVDCLLKSVANATVIVNLNGKNITAKSDENGIMITLDLLEGNYTCNVYFKGNGVYRPSNATFNLNILKRQSDLVLKSKTALYYLDELSISLNGVSNRNILVEIYSNSKKISSSNLKTDKLGIAKVPVKVKSGSYTLKIKFLGDDEYFSTSIVTKLIVKKKKTTLNVPKKTYKSSKKTKKLTATLKTNKGKAILGKKLLFKVNGKKYVAKTNKKGVASVKVKVTKRKTYKFTVSFKGDGYFNKITKKSKLTIK